MTSKGCQNSVGGASGGSPNASSTSPVRNNHLAYQHGHSFIKKTFHKPTNCHYCGDLLWGLMGQGYICEGENMTHNFFLLCTGPWGYIIKLPVTNNP